MIVSTAALLCVVVGVLIALSALRRTSRRVAATSALAQRIFDPQRVANICARLHADEAQIAPLMLRAKNALGDIKRAGDELKLPQATLAVRTAMASVRLLFSGR